MKHMLKQNLIPILLILTAAAIPTGNPCTLASVTAPVNPLIINGEDIMFDNPTPVAGTTSE